MTLANGARVAVVLPPATEPVVWACAECGAAKRPRVEGTDLCVRCGGYDETEAQAQQATRYMRGYYDDHGAKEPPAGQGGIEVQALLEGRAAEGRQWRR